MVSLVKLNAVSYILTVFSSELPRRQIRSTRRRGCDVLNLADDAAALTGALTDDLVKCEPGIVTQSVEVTLHCRL